MQRAPYYIWAPPFIHTSAGIRVLYRLVDALNCAGEEAWVAMWPFVPDRLPENLNTPLLTSDIVRKHRRARQAPIAVYPEVVLGNPLRSSAVVRYVMNEPGLLGGPTEFPGELVFAYGAMLAKALGVTENVLFLPAVTLADFSTPPPGEPRNLVLFYASKFKAVHGKEPFNLPDGALEITRDNEAEPDHATLVKLLRAADRLYLYENSALAIEAPLCGCVTIMMPNPHLGYPIGADDHGMGGIAWGDDPVEIARGQKTRPRSNDSTLSCSDLLRKLNLSLSAIARHSCPGGCQISASHIHGRQQAPQIASSPRTEASRSCLRAPRCCHNAGP
jgi:hypothetical protein